MLTEVAAFIPVAAVVICTPGPDTALTVRNVLMGGRAGGVYTAAGVASGQAVWTVAAGVGLAGLLRASAPAFLAVKAAGAAYLVFLGLQSLWTVRNRHVDIVGMSRPLPGRDTGKARAFRQGFLNDLGNPKMAGFFIGLLPQFAARGGLAGFLGFGLSFCLLTFGWLSCYSMVIALVRNVFDRPRVRRSLDAITGCVLIGLGVRLVAEQR